jgi:3'-phosphoadenosine 5'-phosphosulfate sulfotransferase (PAPS reductase)/FAD synthetase
MYEDWFHLEHPNTQHDGEERPSISHLFRSSYAILDGAIQEHNPSHVYALFSGGHDSVCSTYVASQHPRFSGVVHINTGIGIEQTRQYVRDLCAERQWPLLELHPPQKTYRDIVLKEGFPGSAVHTICYTVLKERALDKLIRERKQGRNDRIILVAGIRKQESARRKKNVNVSPSRREGTRVWVNPIIDWMATDRLPFMEHFGLPRNRVVDLLHMSGECLCGAFASPGERAQIAEWFPETEQVIQDLEAEAAAAGVPCRWGKSPPPWWVQGKAGQMNFLPLCVGCADRGDNNGE